MAPRNCNEEEVNECDKIITTTPLYQEISIINDLIYIREFERFLELAQNFLKKIKPIILFYEKKQIKDFQLFLKNKKNKKNNENPINVISKINPSSLIIEKGIKAALSNGNWIKKKKNNEGGVRQMLQRTSYYQTISCWRKISKK
jgi:DNA-directed RNA polymerase beta subunit